MKAINVNNTWKPKVTPLGINSTRWYFNTYLTKHGISFRYQKQITILINISGIYDDLYEYSRSKTSITIYSFQKSISCCQVPPNTVTTVPISHSFTLTMCYCPFGTLTMRIKPECNTFYFKFTVVGLTPAGIWNLLFYLKYGYTNH